MKSKIFTYASIIFITLCYWACDEKSGMPADLGKIDPDREIATNVELIYSDSAITKFRILAPLMESYFEESKFVEEYPNGLHIEFYDPSKKIISSMQSKYALRVSEEGLMTLRDSVVLINDFGDKLTTSGIVWNELEHDLRTSKFVQLIKVSSQDTFYGFGFHAKDDFSEFSIIQMTGKRRYQNLTKEFEEGE